LIAALEIAQNEVVIHAKANHKAPPPEGGHPDQRYYDRTARLTNSIRPEKVKVDAEILIANVLAGTPGLVEYAAAIEFGTPRSRAYAFLGPALAENENKILAILAGAVKKVIGD
jgi:hypothetical protein